MEGPSLHFQPEGRICVMTAQPCWTSACMLTKGRHFLARGLRQMQRRQILSLSHTRTQAQHQRMSITKSLLTADPQTWQHVICVAVQPGLVSAFVHHLQQSVFTAAFCDLARASLRGFYCQSITVVVIHCHCSQHCDKKELSYTVPQLQNLYTRFYQRVRCCLQLCFQLLSNFAVF